MTIETDLSKVSPQTHRFVGMFREPWSVVIARLLKENPRGIVVGAVIHEWYYYGGPSKGFDTAKEKYLMGHFDVPQYERLEVEAKAIPMCPTCKSSSLVSVVAMKDNTSHHQCFACGWKGDSWQTVPEVKESLADIIADMRNAAEYYNKHPGNGHTHDRFLKFADRLAALEKA